MRAYEIGAQSGLGALRLVERPDLVAAPGQVVVKVGAVCLNHRDLLVMAGAYGPKRPETRTPCSDGVGAVIAIGDGVEGFSIGERVTCPHFVSWIDGPFSPTAFAADLGITLDGWLAEQVAIPAAALVKVPNGVSDAQAAPLPAAGVTAWNALVAVGNVGPGDIVLALGTGGVSVFALQIAKLKGARAAITSSSDEKLAHARKLGADFTINYRTTPDWLKAFLEATGGAGADIIVETGGVSTLGQSIAAAAANGRIVLIGALGGPPAAVPANFSSIIGKNLILKGITEGSRAMLAGLLDAVAGGGVAPVIDREFPFKSAAEAYDYLKSGQHFGKVMIRL